MQTHRLNKRRVRGFSLVELLIAVAVIAILAGMAIPNIASTRSAANESSAISSLRLISKGMEGWRIQNRGGDNGYPVDYRSLAVGNPGDIDAVLGSGQRSGYLFAGGGDTSQYQITAVPVTFGSSGRRSFYVDATGVIRGADHAGAAADSTDPAIQ